MDLILKTARLLLRAPEERDVAAIARLANNWKVASMVGRVPYPYSEEDARSFLAQINSPSARGHEFAITRDDVFIGLSGLEPYPEEAEFGYWLGEPYWGMGFATEAVHAVVRFGFKTLDLSQLVAGHFADNPASGRVLQKLRFRYTGSGMRECLARGCAVESLEMALERADWERR